jgi:type I restriction enzyme S subunit
MNSGLASGDRDDNGIIQLRMNNISTNGKVNLEKLLKIPDLPGLDFYLLKKNDIIFNNTNSLELVGKTAIYNEELEQCSFSNHLTRIRTNSKILPKWLLYQFLHLWSSGVFRAIARSFVGQAGIDSDQLNSIQLAVPPSTDEQLQIITKLEKILGHVDVLILKSQRLDSVLKEKKSALINSVTTKGLRKDIEYIDSGIPWIGEVPKTWDVTKFRRYCHLRQGLQIPQSERYYEPGSDRMEYLTIRSIHAKGEERVREYVENPSSRVVCKIDDVLMARTGATGQVITGQSGAFHNNFFLIDFNQQKINKDFLVYYLSNSRIREYLILVAGTTTIPDLNHDEFLDTPLLVPPMEDQSEIAEFLQTETSNIQVILSKTKMQLRYLRKLRQSLISNVITGKIDILGGTELKCP